MTLYYIVRDGRNRGTRLKPHRYRDGKFRMRREPGEPWIRVEEEQIESYLDKGYILRMGANGHLSGICADSIQGRKG
jgi:hypothetical protein